MGFGMIIFGAIYRYYYKDTNGLIIIVGLALTAIATMVRLKFLKKSN